MIETEVYVTFLCRLCVKLKGAHQKVNEVSLSKMQLHLPLIILTHIQQLVYKREDSG